MRQLFNDLRNRVARRITRDIPKLPLDRLTVESLENRLLLANFTWTGAFSSNWSDPGNWGENEIPTSTDPEGDDVLFFPNSGVVTFNSINDIGTVAASQIRITGNDYNISGGTIQLNANTISAGGLEIEGNNGLISNNLELLTTAGSGQLPFEVTAGDLITLSGIISGPGGFRKDGTGTLVLTGNNTYDGTTFIGGGILQVGNGGGSGSLGDGAVTVNASLVFNRSGNITVANNFSGNNSGSITKTNTNILTLSGNNTYSGATNIDQGQVTVTNGAGIGNNSTVNMATGTTLNIQAGEVIGALASAANNATVNLNATLSTGGNNQSTTFAGVLNGASNLTKNGTGIWTLSGANPNTLTGMVRLNAGGIDLNKAAGVTSIAGALQVGDGVGAANTDVVRLLQNNQIANASAITVNVSGLLNLNNRNDTVGAMTLNSGNVSTGTGTLTLNGNVTANGIVVSGNLPERATISGNVALGGAARTFTVNGHQGIPVLRMEALVSGVVGLTKAGNGQMRLFANNTYTGVTTLNAGVLVVEGNQGGSPTTVNGGRLEGSGRIGALTMAANSTLRPSSLEVNGNVTFANNQTTFSVVPVTAAVLPLASTGTVTLANASLQVSVFQVIPPLNTAIPIIGGTTVTGTFNGLANNAIVVDGVQGHSYRVNYNPTNVTLTRINGPAFQQRAITPVVDEGNIATLTGHITTIFPNDKFFLEVNWGDGRSQTFTFTPNASRDVELTHRYRDNGSYNVELLWRDQRGGFNTDTLAVTVNNVAPQVFVGSDVSLLPGGNLLRRGFIDDPGADSWTATVDYGDGTGPQSLRIQGNSFLLRHRYQVPGEYTVTITVQDDDGDTGVASLVVESIAASL